MSIIRVERRARYVAVAYSSVVDAQLSLSARGLHHYCLAQPDDWQFRTEQLAEACGETEYKIRKWLKELRRYGYAELRPTRNELGQLTGSEWVIRENAATEIAKTAISVDSPRLRKTETRQAPSLGKNRDSGKPPSRTLLLNNNNNNTDPDFSERKRESPGSEVDAGAEARALLVDLGVYPSVALGLVEDFGPAPVLAKVAELQALQAEHGPDSVPAPGGWLVAALRPKAKRSKKEAPAVGQLMTRPEMVLDFQRRGLPLNSMLEHYERVDIPGEDIPKWRRK